MAGHFADSSIQWPATTIYVIYDRRRLAMPLTPLYRAGHCLFSANSLEHFTCSKWPATLQFPAYNGRPQPFMTGAGWPCLLLPCMVPAIVFSCQQFGSGHSLFTLLPSPFLIVNGRPLCSFQHTMASHNHFLTGVGWPCILLPCMGSAIASLCKYMGLATHH